MKQQLLLILFYYYLYLFSGRHGRDRVGRDRIGRDRVGRDRIGRDRIGRDRIGRDCIGRDRMVVGVITTYTISASHNVSGEFESRPGEMYSIQQYVIKFVRDLRQVFSMYSGFFHQ